MAEVRDAASLSSLELDRDEPLTADHPCIVPGIDAVGVAGNEVHFGSIVRGDVERARDDVAEVGGLAAVASGQRLDAFRPPEPRLRPQPLDRH
jgi:hypothetical protein